MSRDPVLYVDRQTKELLSEKIYGENALRFLYGKSRFGRTLAHLLSRLPLFSRCFGLWNSLPFSRRKIAPFVKTYGIKVEEFAQSLSSFPSFNAFFYRKLKEEARPFAQEASQAIIPTDGRFLFYSRPGKQHSMIVKGERFCLANLLQDEKLAARYEEGEMVIGRLCPTDYHRFHFPVDCTPGAPRLINGPLYSVNPIALRKNLKFLVENKRIVTELKTPSSGTLLAIEIGATSVGSIHQTFTPFRFYRKGEEKGYFSFGGSALILLFEPGSIRFDADLLHYSTQHQETLCLLGQSLGKLQNYSGE